MSTQSSARAIMERRTDFRRASALTVAALVALVVLSGCFRLSRKAPQIQYFTLAGASQSGASQSGASSTVSSAAGSSVGAAQASAAGRALTIGVRRLDLASYLSADPGIVVRRGASRLDVSEFHQWAGELDETINRAVAAHLAGVPPVRAVDVAPWPARASHDFLVQLRISRFEGVVDSAATSGQVHVLADWDIVRPIDNTILLRGRTDDRRGSFRYGDYGRLAIELDAALSRLAREIGDCMARFPNDSTPPASCGTGAPSGAAR